MVHKVVDKRISKSRRVEYQVDWGPRYGADRYSWEPEANLPVKNAKDKIGDYLQSLGAGAVDSERRKRKKKK